MEGRRDSAWRRVLVGPDFEEYVLDLFLDLTST